MKTEEQNTETSLNISFYLSTECERNNLRQLLMRGSNGCLGGWDLDGFQHSCSDGSVSGKWRTDISGHKAVSNMEAPLASHEGNASREIFAMK